METIELVSRLVLAFILFFALGVSATIVLFKIFFKPLSEEELKDWMPNYRTIKSIKSEQYYPEYTIHRKAS